MSGHFQHRPSSFRPLPPSRRRPLTPARTRAATVRRSRATPSAAPAVGLLQVPLRIVVVHWKIRFGFEQEFLDYWATQARVNDRSGLVSEFLSTPADHERLPWISAQARDPRWSSFFNIGTWRDEAAFHDQIGRYIDESRPPLPFEAERRERILLAPERWRVGDSDLPARDQRDVL